MKAWWPTLDLLSEYSLMRWTREATCSGLASMWLVLSFSSGTTTRTKIGTKSGVQFVDETVRSLYVTKQDEFREWMRTHKKRTFLGKLPKARAHEVFHEIIDNVDPKGYPLGVWAIAKAYKQ